MCSRVRTKFRTSKSEEFTVKGRGQFTGRARTTWCGIADQGTGKNERGQGGKRENAD